MPRISKHLNSSLEPPIIEANSNLSKDAISEFVDSYLELKDDCDELKDVLIKYKIAKNKITN